VAGGPARDGARREASAGGSGRTAESAACERAYSVHDGDVLDGDRRDAIAAAGRDAPAVAAERGA
jgi:hypothetical protein